MPRPRRIQKLMGLLLPVAGVSLMLAVWGGLVRLGIEAGSLPASAASAHGALMIFGFFGVLIGLERAIALQRDWGYLTPLLGVVGAGALLVADATPQTAGVLFGAAGTMYLLVTITLLVRTRAVANALLAAASVPWIVGALLWAAGAERMVVVPWWVAFLVLTIVGERTQFGKLAMRTRTTVPVLGSLAALLVTGVALVPISDTIGLATAGAAMLAISTWMILNDAKKRTRKPGLLRYVSLGLLGAYAWLGISGLLWIFHIHGGARYAVDAGLHALLVGFVLGMVFSHATMIFPAITGKRMPYHWSVYAPALVLHVGVAVRVVGGLADSEAIVQVGGAANALAIVSFALWTVGSVIAGEIVRRVGAGITDPPTATRTGRNQSDATRPSS